jgi:hypothetical protein
LVFVDETGVNLALTRTHGRAPRGVRVVGAVPQNYGQSLTVLAALDHRGIRATLLIPGATDGEVFHRFVQHVLLPTLRRGDIRGVGQLERSQSGRRGGGIGDCRGDATVLTALLA